MNSTTIIVNSSDGFEDCWYPFFTLFDKYWPECKVPIMLNTEHKTFTHPSSLNIISSKVNAGIDRRLTWSECLMAALNKIDTPLVLYLQEDYFLERPVNVEAINDLTEKMLADDMIKYIGLTNSGNRPPFHEYKPDKSLRVVSKRSKYRISTQAGLWRRDTLLSYLKEDENGWMFEIFGTQRAKKRNDFFLTVNEEMFNENNPLFYYQVTGIIKGKWLSTMPSLFEKEGLKMDFNIRGFYKTPTPFFRKLETFKKLIKNPLLLYNGLMGK